MGHKRRFDVYYDKHLGFGIRWGSFHYQIEIAISIPFVTFFIGIGSEQD